jgi:large subunit ribosomal protein L22
MAHVTAQLSNYRQAPRKVRLVANLIAGKTVAEALMELNFLAKRAADPIKKLVGSAVANAKNLNIATESLVVKSITVNQGPIMKRSMPRARGRAFPIHKHTSHIVIVLDTEITKNNKKRNKEVKASTK